MLADVSVFTLKEVQLQRDPGYRNASYPESGEGVSCQEPTASCVLNQERKLAGVSRRPKANAAAPGEEGEG